MSKDRTIEEMKSAKRELETQLQNLISDFENKYEATVWDIDQIHVRDSQSSYDVTKLISIVVKV